MSYRLASDGLIARGSGEWAKDKLYYVSRYFDIFNGGMKNLWPRRTYIDMLAGPGRCFLEDRPTEEFEGSPLLAFNTDPGFSSILCFESGAENANALERRLLSANNIGRAQVRPYDCNSQPAIDEAREILRGSLGVIFIDTLGLTDVAFSTVAAIVENRKADLVITLHVNEFTRNANMAAAGDPDHAPRFDRFFGTPLWRERLRAFQNRTYGAVDEADALTDLYLEQLGGLGYVHCAPLHRLMKNSRNVPLYRLIFASRDDRGVDFWRKVTHRPPTNQGSLF